jgi:hypothetical protein
VHGGQTWQDSAAALLGSAGTGWEIELTRRAHASVRGEREDAGMEGVNQRRKRIL